MCNEPYQKTSYIIPTINGALGMQIAFEIIDSVLDQAESEFFQVMQSLEFVQTTE